MNKFVFQEILNESENLSRESKEFPAWKETLLKTIQNFQVEREKCNKEVPEEIDPQKIIACRVTNSGNFEKSLEKLGDQLLEFSVASVKFEKKFIDQIRMCLNLSGVFHKEKIDSKK